MFFVLSKVGWWLVDPGNVLLLGLVAGAALLLFQPTRRWGRRLILLVAAVSLVVAVVPIGRPMLAYLEARFPPPETLPDEVAGIVVLGGMIQPTLSEHYGRVQLNGNVERLTEGAALAERYPEARLIFTGGAGNLLRPEHREATWAARVLRQLGIPGHRIEIEHESRNTYENAVETLRLAKPQPDERWILVTSAFHMPRAVGCFRAAGWPQVIPYPVDYHTLGPGQSFGLGFSLRGGLNRLSGTLHEFLGLLAYRLTGRTDTLLPAP